MKKYRYTDNLLLVLAVGNLAMIGPLIWAFWFMLSLAFNPHEGDAATYVLNILIHGIGIELVILVASAFVFFKRWRLALLLYIPYTMYMLPRLIEAVIYYYKSQALTDTVFYLPAKVHTWAYTTLLGLTIITLFVFIIEILNAKFRTDN